MTLRLSHFVFASVLIHGGAYSLLGTSPPRSLAGEALNVTLLPATHATPAADTTYQHASSHSGRSKNVEHEDMHRTIADMRAANRALEQPRGEIDRRPPQPIRAEAGDAGSSALHANARAQSVAGKLSHELLQALAPYFSYPALARHQGWEGEVQVDVHIEPDGQLRLLRVAQTSGYAVLDNAALDSFAKIRRLPSAPDWLNGAGFDLRIPVVYRLTEG